MNKSRKLPWMAAVAMSLIFAWLASAQEKTITLVVNNANQPSGGVPLYVLAGGRKFSQSTPPTGTTDNTGKFVFPPGVLSSNKAHLQMEVYEVCMNGQKAIFVLPKGSEDQLPKDTEDCKKRRIGGFYWDGGSTVPRFPASKSRGTNGMPRVSRRTIGLARRSSPRRRT